MKFNKILRVASMPAIILFSLILTACISGQNSVSGAQASHSKSAADYVISEQEYNKHIVMQYMEALSTSLMPSVAKKILAPDYQEIRREFANIDYHAAGSELATIADPINEAIINRRNSTEFYIAEDDMVVVRYMITGKHAGNFYGIAATDTDVEVLAGAVFWLQDGKITKSWSMADEAGFLRQIGKPLPARADGRFEAWPYVLPVRSGNEIMKEALANPIDSQEYRNKLQLNAWKAPAYKEQVLHKDQSQRVGLRRGFFHIVNAASAEAATEFPFSGAFPDREDKIAALVADGKRTVILFRLTATNSHSLVGLPALNRPIAAYEFGFQEFDGDVWKFNSWFGDDLGLLLQIGGPQDHWFSAQK